MLKEVVGCYGPGSFLHLYSHFFCNGLLPLQLCSLPVDQQLVSNFFAFIIFWLTWLGSGLGCWLNTCLLLYAMLSTISWMVIVLSSFLSHYSITAPRKNLSARITRKLSIILRRLGKVIASTNAIWIVILCLFLLLDRHCCNSWDSGARGFIIDCTKC
jgi:hypothetical protein